MDYRLKRVIDFFREEMVANAAGGSGGFSGSANAAGPVAGFDPVMGKRFLGEGLSVDGLSLFRRKRNN